MPQIEKSTLTCHTVDKKMLQGKKDMNTIK